MISDLDMAGLDAKISASGYGWDDFVSAKMAAQMIGVPWDLFGQYVTIQDMVTGERKPVRPDDLILCSDLPAIGMELESFGI